MLRACAAAVAALALGISIGVAPAHAELVAIPMPPKAIHKVSREGYAIEMRLERESVTPTPNLAAAPNSHEAFITISGIASATGGSSPITDSVLIIGYQLGCQNDVSAGLQFGGTGGSLPNGTVAVTPGSPTTTDLGNAGGGAGFGQTVVQPGVIVDLPLSNMTLNDKGQAALDMDDLHIKADACGGAVTIRSYLYLRISTQLAHTQYAIFGDPINI
jgi:MspA